VDVGMVLSAAPSERRNQGQRKPHYHANSAKGVANEPKEPPRAGRTAWAHTSSRLDDNAGPDEYGQTAEEHEIDRSDEFHGSARYPLDPSKMPNPNSQEKREHNDRQITESDQLQVLLARETEDVCKSRPPHRSKRR